MRFKAQHLPNLKGPAAWNEILPARISRPQLEGKLTADYVIIGAGFAGLSAARRLTQLVPKARIILLDALAIAESSAGRNSGFMIDLPHVLTSTNYTDESQDPDEPTRLNRMAITFAKDAVEEYGINPAFFDQVGKVNGAASVRADHHNADYKQQLDALAEPYEWLDDQAMFKLTGSRHYRSGLYTPGTVLLQPAGYIRGLADGLDNHVTLYEQSPVIAFEQQGKDWQVHTKKGSVTTPTILLANNGHLASFGFAKRQLLQVFLYASMSAELDQEAIRKLGGESRWGITPSDPMGTTLRRIDTPLGGNRIVTRTCASLRPNMVITNKDVKRAANIHQKKFDKRFPNLAGMKQEYQWAGHLCLSNNDVSICKEVEQSVYAACVQNGLGTARGTLTGICAAELACGHASQITDFFAKEAKPVRLPSSPFLEWGGNTLIRFKEWRAREE